MTDWHDLAQLLDEVLELPASQRAERVAALPPPLRHEIDALLAAHASAGAFLSDTSATDGPELAPGDRLGPWRVERAIGRGGMGAVYRVVRDDGQFEMTAAAKVVAAGQITADTARRFRDERQILASLDHPNIARLVDGGVDALDRPYLVMELVDGEPLESYVRGRPLETRLELFRTVCAAVHCAHQRLLVHRDIKPGNILVTSDGTVKLVDFGIATRLEASGVVPMWEPLTPAYASPEQLRGDVVTTATDVWSLGAVLYAILATGSEPPQSGVGVGSESTLTPVADADLAAIVRRAMHQDPAARYASAVEMSADVDRFLRGYPIDARPRSWRYSAAKYLRRHRTGVALAAVALIAVAVAAAAAIWQARLARRAQLVAERRYEDVRQLAGTMIFGAHDRIAPLTGSSDARRFLVEQGLAYLDRLAAETNGDVALERELTAAYMRLGDVQGRPSDFNLGDASGALASYAKAEALAQRLVGGKGPGRAAAEDVRRLAIIHGRVSDVYLFERRPEALARAQAAVDTLASAALDTKNRDTQLALGYARFMLAATTQSLGDTHAGEHWEAALAIYERLLEGDPSNDDLQRNVALIHKNIGTFHQGKGDPARVLNQLEMALAIDRARVVAAPKNPTARLDLSFDLTEVATVHFNRREFTAAADYYRQAVELRQALADEDPRDVRARGRLAYAEARLGRILTRLPQPNDARTQFENAIRNADQVLSVTPAAVNTIGDRAIARAGLAAVTRNCGLLRQASADIDALGTRAPAWLRPTIDEFRSKACPDSQPGR